MAKMDELKAKDSRGSITASVRLEDRINVSEKKQNAVLSKVMGSIIIDKLVHPNGMQFEHMLSKSGTGDVQLALDHWAPIHPHAMGQIADVSGLTRTYKGRLADSPHDWAHELLVYNLNTLFSKTKFVDRKGAPKRFLVRMVNAEVRGFLSQNFNRKLTTAPLLRSFIENCRMHGAGPIETTATDVRVRVKYMLPYVFEPVAGEYVAFGVTFGNSDFGAGRLSISGTVMRITSGTTAVLSDKYSRTHLGSVIQDSDIEMSQETADKELDTVRSAIGDTVMGLLGEDAIRRSISVIQRAHDKEVPWHKLKNQIGSLLGKEEVDMLEHILHGGASVIDLPPVNMGESDDGSSPTAWWASNAVSTFADKADDPDRKSALQNLAGKLMTG